MSSPVNIMILCNNEMAIPAMQQLYQNGSLQCVVVPEKNTALFSLLQQMLTGTGVTILSVNKKTLEHSIRKIAAEKNITTAWLMTFAYILPKSLLHLLAGGFINFHYGLLPKYRGANPVLAQMLNGEKESGITIHVVDEHIDTGPIVMQQKINIEEGDTFGMQLQKLGMLGASMAIKLLQVCRLHPVPPALPQNESQAMYFKKPVAADLMINWKTMSSKQVIRLINACNPWNKGAGTLINGIGLCLTAAVTTHDNLTGNIPAGTIVGLDAQEGLKIYCLDDVIIKISIFYTPEGFFTGEMLLFYGIKRGDIFIS